MQPRLERLPSPPPSIFASAASLPGFLFSSATCVPPAAVRLVNIMCISLFPASPEHLGPGTRFPGIHQTQGTDLEETISRAGRRRARCQCRHGIGAAADAATIRQIRSGPGSPEQDARPAVHSNAAGPRQRQLGSPAGRWPDDPALNLSRGDQAAGRHEARVPQRRERDDCSPVVRLQSSAPWRGTI